MPTHASALAIGHKLQEYIIGRLLGHGGFGLTYLAQDTNLNALVAIKEFLPQEFAVRNADNSVVPKSEFDSDSYTWGLERFKEEARALARFKHPNIVRVSRLLEANSTAYMVMDFEPGLTLSQYLKRYGPTLDEGRLLGIFLPALDGLEALHRLQLVHRDIKPSNIYVRAFGGPMLIDFGAVRQAIGAQSQNLTSLVTPGYAPIEQYSSDGRQGAWSDLYAVGASIYYCMFGHAPADAARRSAIMSDGGEDPYAIATTRGAEQYSRELLECVDWALQFRVRDRPQSAHELRERLRTSPVPPQIIEVPESLNEVPELQHGVMSAPTMPSPTKRPAPSPTRAPQPGSAAGYEPTQVSAPTSHGPDSLAPLIDGTRRNDATQVMPHTSLVRRARNQLRRFGSVLAAQFETATQDPSTLTARLAQHLREPRGLRIALTSLVVLVLALSILIYTHRINGAQRQYDATVAVGTVQAYQDYLKSCGNCAHKADAQAALDRLQQGLQTATLEGQFKDLLAKKALQAPASPNATDVLQQLASTAPNDPYLPQARTQLAEAIQAATPNAPPAPVKHLAARPAARKAAAPVAAAAGVEQMPMPLYKPDVPYPTNVKKKVLGSVDVEFQVNTDGTTSAYKILRSTPKGLFDAAVVKAAARWVYTPYTLNRVPMPKRIVVRVDFKP